MAGTGPLRADARRNRETLLTVARQVLAEEGMDTSLRDIARRAGVGIGTLYRHFPTREALLEAALGEGLDGLREAAARGAASDTPGEALLDWFDRFAAGASVWCQVADETLTAAHRDGQDGPDGSDVSGTYRAMTEAVDALLRRAQEAGEVRRDVDTLDLLTAAKAVGWATARADADRAARLLAVLRDGLRTPPEAP
ncbi:TetR/AcrR family transcriptional regulator [Streptomyces sp. NPDC049879]|uniref:TetR/AcrR family transcriptional regulator n=1 Tax=Streptomyces sp. NPDC049879 TaxID=3365598 RepID=UPI0037AAC203